MDYPFTVVCKRIYQPKDFFLAFISTSFIAIRPKDQAIYLLLLIFTIRAITISRNQAIQVSRLDTCLSIILSLHTIIGDVVILILKGQQFLCLIANDRLSLKMGILSSQIYRYTYYTSILILIVVKILAQ